MTDVKVRLGVAEDDKELEEMSKLLWADNGIVDYDDDLLAEMRARAYRPDGLAVFGVIGPVGGKIEGMVYLAISNFMWTRKHHLEEIMSFVRPESRKPDRINALIEFSKKCAIDGNVPLIMGLFTNIRLSGKVHLYRKYFGYPSGAVFTFNSKFEETEKLSKDFWAMSERGRGKKHRVNGVNHH
jgi:SAM-dependent methyltransferase